MAGAGRWSSASHQCAPPSSGRWAAELCRRDHTPQVKPRVDGCEPRQPRHSAGLALVPHTRKVLSAREGEPPTGHTCANASRDRS